MIRPDVTVTDVQKLGINTMLEHLGIEITEIGSDFLCGTMPVDHRTHQPMGLLHGGASAVLIESLGSIGSSLMVDLKTQSIVGIEINANHLRGVRSGTVTGRAQLVHGGRTTHVWQVNITDENDKLVCTGRLTVLVVPQSNS